MNETSITTNVLRDVLEERVRQDSKWGIQEHSLVVWLAILAEEFGEAAKDINEFHFRYALINDIRAELVQTAAVAVAMIEYMDRHSIEEIVEKEFGGTNAKT